MIIPAYVNPTPTTNDNCTTHQNISSIIFLTPILGNSNIDIYKVVLSENCEESIVLTYNKSKQFTEDAK